MIVVIADDLSGAAELAGRAYEYGLSGEIQTVWNPASQAEVVALDAATRSLPESEAAARMGRLAAEVATSRPRLVFKKIDSVLRGWVRAETQAMLAALGRRRALIVPANPSRDRIIRGGQYLVSGQPLDQTVFARDPEHPRRSSDVCTLLAASEHSADGDADSLPVSNQVPLPTTGLLIPDTASSADLTRWAAALDDDTLAVGGVDYFGAVLAQVVGVRDQSATRRTISLPAAEATVLVCGSAAAWDSRRAQQAAEHGLPVEPFPASLFAPTLATGALDSWARTLEDRLQKARGVMVAVGRAVDPSPVPAVELAARLGQAVEQLLARRQPGLRICIEGGATATSVLGRLGVNAMTVEASLGPGIVAVRPSGAAERQWILKPGSYDWPAAIWPA